MVHGLKKTIKLGENSQENKLHHATNEQKKSLR